MNRVFDHGELEIDWPSHAIHQEHSINIERVFTAGSDDLTRSYITCSASSKILINRLAVAQLSRVTNEIAYPRF